MYRTQLLVVTALAEGVTGLILLLAPSIMLALLLGVNRGAAETAVCARIAGAALLSFGVACWVCRGDQGRPARRGQVLGVLLYDLAAAGILAHAGWAGGLAGIALWPAVALHSTLAAWCALALRDALDDGAVSAGADPKAGVQGQADRTA